MEASTSRHFLLREKQYLFSLVLMYWDSAANIGSIVYKLQQLNQPAAMQVYF